MRCATIATLLLSLATLGALTSQAAVDGAAPLPEPAAAALSPPAPAVSNATGGNKLTFCVANWAPVPLALCNNATSTHPANFTGHDVEMIRAAAQRLGLLEGTDFGFQCVSFGFLTAALVQQGSPCSAAAAGITITSEREAQGIQFTYPYLKSSLGILVQSNKERSDGWGFVRPFSWNLWLALLLTLLLFPPLVLFIEFMSLHKSIHRDDVLPGVGESGWRTALTLMLYDAINVTSLGARVAVLTFGFLALLTTSTYTANLAAFVTVSTISSRINSVEDLRGKAVGTSPIYASRLQKYGIQAATYAFNNGSDYLTWRGLVATGQLAAVVRDMPPLLWVANNAPLCDVRVLSQEIEPFDYGVAFHSNTSDKIVEAWSSAILRMQEDGTLQQLQESWIFDPTSGCGARSQVQKDQSAVSFQDLSGLWIIAGAGAGAGCLIMVAERAFRRRQKRLQAGKQRQRSLAMQPEGRRRRLVSFARLKTGKQRSGGPPDECGTGSRWRVSHLSEGEASCQLDSAKSGPKPGDWDLESQELESQDSTHNGQHAAAAPASHAALPPSSSPPPFRPAQLPLQQQSVPGVAPLPREGQPLESRPSLRRVSALQKKKSIYSSYNWKSEVRQSARQPPEAGELP